MMVSDGYTGIYGRGDTVQTAPFLLHHVSIGYA